MFGCKYMIYTKTLANKNIMLSKLLLINICGLTWINKPKNLTTAKFDMYWKLKSS